MTPTLTPHPTTTDAGAPAVLHPYRVTFRHPDLAQDVTWTRFVAVPPAYLDARGRLADADGALTLAADDARAVLRAEYPNANRADEAATAPARVWWTAMEDGMDEEETKRGPGRPRLWPAVQAPETDEAIDRLDPVALVRAAVTASGMTTAEFAFKVMAGRDARNVRRWLDGGEDVVVPNGAQDFLRWWIKDHHDRKRRKDARRAARAAKAKAKAGKTKKKHGGRGAGQASGDDGRATGGS